MTDRAVLTSSHVSELSSLNSICTCTVIIFTVITAGVSSLHCPNWDSFQLHFQTIPLLTSSSRHCCASGWQELKSYSHCQTATVADSCLIKREPPPLQEGCRFPRHVHLVSIDHCKKQSTSKMGSRYSSSPTTSDSCLLARLRFCCCAETSHLAGAAPHQEELQG